CHDLDELRRGGEKIKALERMLEVERDHFSDLQWKMEYQELSDRIRTITRQNHQHRLTKRRCSRRSKWSPANIKKAGWGVEESVPEVVENQETMEKWWKAQEKWETQERANYWTKMDWQ